MKEQLMKEYARKRNVATVRRLTQEELLAEAKITEEMNLRSLGKLAIRFMKFLHLGSLQHYDNRSISSVTFRVQFVIGIVIQYVMCLVMVLLEIYQKMELEKKKARNVKQTYRGPMIRYHSVTMPLIEELRSEPDINVESISGDNEG